MTPTQRAAAERLVADQSSSNLEWSRQVVDLLRELLAEPVQEPVAQATSGHIKRLADKLAEARAAKEIPTGDLWRSITQDRYDKAREELFDAIDAYAAPQQRHPLTDEQIIAIANLCSDSLDDDCTQNLTTVFARAIERANGIGEQE